MKWVKRESESESVLFIPTIMAREYHLGLYESKMADYVPNKNYFSKW